MRSVFMSYVAYSIYNACDMCIVSCMNVYETYVCAQYVVGRYIRYVFIVCDVCM